MARITDEQTNDLARYFSKVIRDFYKNPENIKKYEEWKSSRPTNEEEES